MGWTFNTKDPDAPTTGPMITGVAVALTTISLITVCLRVYVRGFMIRAFGVDDWIILVTWFCAAGFAIVTIVQTRWGLGLQHIQDLPAEDIYNFGLLQYMGAPFYITSILGFKLALLFSYLRFAPRGAYRTAIHCIIVACILFHLSFLLVQLNLCQPARKQWDPSITHGSCIKGVPFYTAMGSITILFDVTVMLLPFPVLLKSHIQLRKKLILLGLFGLGVFITVIQIVRIQTVKQLSNYVDSAPLILWSAVENNLGLIVANVPTLAPLVKYYNERSSTRKLGSSTGRNGDGKSGGYYARKGTAGTAGGTTAVAVSRSRHSSRPHGGDGGIYAGGSTYKSDIRTWNASRNRSSTKLDALVESGSVNEGTELESVDNGHKKKNGSMDSILDTTIGSGSGRSSPGSKGRRSEGDGDVEGKGEGGWEGRVRPPTGITKRVEVVITRH